MTNHAIERSQQRCIPPLIIHWLCKYSVRTIFMGSVVLLVFMARHVSQGMALVLHKRRNAGMNTNRTTLRASL